jgi:hypothetical protein
MCVAEKLGDYKSTTPAIQTKTVHCHVRRSIQTTHVAAAVKVLQNKLQDLRC